MKEEQDAIFLEKEWRDALKDSVNQKNFLQLLEYINHEYRDKQVFPRKENVFKAFELTPFSNVNVVILGQDPYHNEGQADGMSFSVSEGVTVPPSLKNIYKEIHNDIGTQKDMSNGNLQSWASQGVLLLNSILTVVAHTPLAHKNKGWEDFTDTVISTVSRKRDHVVFILWGNYAKSKKTLIDGSKHLILEASHPSPFSAYNGFFGCNHFSQCNNYLEVHGKATIVW